MHDFNFRSREKAIFESRCQLGDARLEATYYIIHPWAGEDLGLKIDDRDQTIWICILEL